MRRPALTAPSRVVVLWHLFGRPFRVLPRANQADGVLVVSWLGTQTIVAVGADAQALVSVLGGRGTP